MAASDWMPPGPSRQIAAFDDDAPPGLSLCRAAPPLAAAAATASDRAPLTQLAAPSFEHLLVQLSEAHQRELEELRSENIALRAQVASTPRSRRGSQSTKDHEEANQRLREVLVQWNAGNQAAEPQAAAPSPSSGLCQDAGLAGSVAAEPGADAPASPRAGSRSPLGQQPALLPSPSPQLSPDLLRREMSPNLPQPGMLLEGTEERAASKGSNMPAERTASKGSTGSSRRPLFLPSPTAQSVRNLTDVVAKSRSATATRIFGDVQTRHINFQQLVETRHPGLKWEDLATKEKVHLLRKALKPRHWMINPRCSVVRYWDSLTALALICIAFATPYEVAFLPEVVQSFFIMNRVVDVIFIIDMMLRFLLQVEIQRPHRGGSLLLRNPMQIRKRYLRSWFLIDLVSLCPFDLVSLYWSGASQQWRKVKILRCLRLLRLVKLLRMLRVSSINEHWRDAIGLKQSSRKLVRFSVVLVLVSHWMACLWGFTGLSLGASLCDGEGDRNGITSLPAEQVSWVTTLYTGGKHTPDSPCSHFSVYVASLHWAVMTLTSIGYGDIVPVRVEEYLLTILCMFTGGVLWAYVIACVTSIISNRSPVERDFECNTDLLNVAMREARVPYSERPQYREFLREAKSYDRRIIFSQIAARFSPLLRKSLMFHISKETLTTVYYFNGPAASPQFLMEVSARLAPKFFSRLESLDGLRQCLCMMDRGTVAHCGAILVHPSVFHEDFIISNKRFQKVTSTVSLTFTQVLVLTKADIEELLALHPKIALRIRRIALKTAFCRAVKMTLIAYEKMQAETGAELSLSQAFDRICWDTGAAMPKQLRTLSRQPSMVLSRQDSTVQTPMDAEVVRVQEEAAPDLVRISPCVCKL